MMTRKQRKQQSKAIDRRKRIAKHVNIQNNNVKANQRSYR